MEQGGNSYEGSPIPEHPAKRVPWGLREVGLGIGCLGVWMAVAFGAALVVRALEWRSVFAPLLAALEVLLLAPVWWLAVRRYGARLGDLGLTRFRLRDLGLGVVLLVPALWLSGLYQTWLAGQGLEMQPGLEQALQQAPWPVVLITTAVVLAPLVEEIFFRGFLYAGFRTRLPWGVSAVLSAGLFALLHLQPLAAPVLFLLGLLFAYLYHRSGSIWPAIVLHLLVNTVGVLGVYLV